MISFARELPSVNVDTDELLATMLGDLDQVEAETDPSTWPEWTDEVWTLGPEPDDGPTAEDWADYREMRGEAEAREHLDRSASLSLDELVELQASFYRSWPSEAGEMIARELDSLALRIRMTDATTPAEFGARKEALEADARDTWEAIGYEQGRMSCPCHSADSFPSAFGHGA